MLSRRTRPQQEKGKPDHVLGKLVDLLVVAGFDYRFRQVSAAYEPLLGYSQKELLARSYLELVHPDDRERTRQEADKLAASDRRTVRFENRYRRKDGSYRWLSWSARSNLEEGVLYAVARDITEYKRSEEAVRQSRAELQAILDHTSAAIYVKDLEGRYTLANRRCAQVLGLRSADIVGKTDEELFPAAVAKAYRRNDRRVLKAGSPLQIEETTVRNGATRISISEKFPLLGPRGEAYAVCGISTDITERKHAEERLAHNEASLAEAQEVAHVGSWEWDIAANEITWSDELYRVFGLEPGEFVASYETYLESVHPDDRVMTGQAVERAVSDQRSFSFHHRIVRPDGEQRVLLCRGRVAVEAGTSSRLFGTCQDVTDRKRTEDALREAEQRFRGAFETAPIGMALVAPDGSWLDANRALCELTGYSLGELRGMTVRDVTHPDDADADHDLGRRMLDGHIRDYQMEKRYLHAEGRIVWGLLSVSLLRDSDGQPVHFVSQVLDITERKRGEQVLGAQHAVARVLAEASSLGSAIQKLLEALGEGMQWDVGTAWRIDEEAGVLRCSAYWHHPSVKAPEFERLTRKTAFARGERLPGRVWQSGEPVVISDLRKGPNSARGKAAASAGLRSGICLPVLSGSDVLGVLEFMSWESVSLDEGLLDLLTTLASQVGQFVTRRRAEEQLAHQALHDSLTGLPNRALLTDRLDHALTRLERASGWLAVLFLDVDNFKRINDTLGHTAGDELLRELGSRIGQALRPVDTVARLGGDEFVVLCESLQSEREAVITARRLLETLAPPFTLAGEEHVVTASVGIAMADRPGREPDVLIGNADAAMYRAKELGKARYELFDEAMRTRSLERLDMEKSLQGALRAGELRLHYQALVLLDTRRISGVEALLRWQHPERGLLGPDEFMAVAEESGLIVPIGSWVLHEACAQAARWRAGLGERAPLPINVNLSARQMAQPELPEMITRSLREAGLDPGDLALEMTESALMESTAVPAATLEALKGLGVRILLDDFGTGYSSLSYLKRFPIDTLKVDRSFVASLGSGTQDAAIMEAVVGMARALDLAVVAEGVETEAQARASSALGCGCAQGYLFARPLPPEEIPGLLDRSLPGPG